MLFANAFNLDQSEILSHGKEEVWVLSKLVKIVKYHYDHASSNHDLVNHLAKLTETYLVSCIEV